MANDGSKGLASIVTEGGGLANLVICGAGGLGREILSLVRRDYAGWFNVIAFIDDSPNSDGTVEGLPVYSQDFLDTRELAVVIGFANPKQKSKLFSRLEAKPNLSFPNILSKYAIINSDAKLGKGIVVTDFCSIATKAVIEDAVFLNVAAIIGHDAKIGRACSIMPQCAVSGFVSVGEETLIGAQSFIMQGKAIGKGAIVSAGSVVCKNLRDGEVAVTAPTKVLKANQ